MLIIAGTFEVEPERRADFLAGHHATMLRSQSEPGCLDYVMSADPLDTRIVRLFERWTSKDDLAAHIEALAATPRADDAVSVLASDVVQYEISAVGTVGS